MTNTNKGGNTSIPQDPIDLIIVDDEVDFCDLVQIVGEGLGLNASVATDGKTFKALFRRYHPRAVAFDLVMPDMDGIELLQWVVKEPHHPQIGFMSGYNESYMQAATMLAQLSRLTIFGTLQKPASMAEIEKFLRPLTSSC